MDTLRWGGGLILATEWVMAFKWVFQVWICYTWFTLCSSLQDKWAIIWNIHFYKQADSTWSRIIWLLLTSHHSDTSSAELYASSYAAKRINMETTMTGHIWGWNSGPLRSQGRQTGVSVEVTRKSQNLINNCQLLCFSLPWLLLPTQNQAERAKYVPQTKCLRCPLLPCANNL